MKMKTKTKVKYDYTPTRVAKITKIGNNKCQQVRGATGTHTFLMGLYFGTITWKTAWYYVLNLNLFYDPEVSIPGIYPAEICTYASKDMHRMFRDIIHINPKLEAIQILPTVEQINECGIFVQQYITQQ